MAVEYKIATVMAIIGGILLWGYAHSVVLV